MEPEATNPQPGLNPQLLSAALSGDNPNLENILLQLPTSDLVRFCNSSPEIKSLCGTKNNFWRNKFLTEVFFLPAEKQTKISNWFEYYSIVKYLSDIFYPKIVLNEAYQNPKYQQIPFFWEWYAFTKLLPFPRNSITDIPFETIKENLNVIRYFDFCAKYISSSLNYIGDIDAAHGIETIDEHIQESLDRIHFSARYQNYDSNSAPIPNYAKGFKKIKSSKYFTLAIDYFNQVYVSGVYLNFDPESDHQEELVTDVNGFQLFEGLLAKDIDSHGYFFMVLDINNVIWVFGPQHNIDEVKDKYQILYHIPDYDTEFSIDPGNDFFGIAESNEYSFFKLNVPGKPGRSPYNFEYLNFVPQIGDYADDIPSIWVYSKNETIVYTSGDKITLGYHYLKPHPDYFGDNKVNSKPVTNIFELDKFVRLNFENVDVVENIQPDFSFDPARLNLKLEPNEYIEALYVLYGIQIIITTFGRMLFCYLESRNKEELNFNPLNYHALSLSNIRQLLVTGDGIKAVWSENNLIIYDNLNIKYSIPLSESTLLLNMGIGFYTDEDNISVDYGKRIYALSNSGLVGYINTKTGKTEMQNNLENIDDIQCVDGGVIFANYGYLLISEQELTERRNEMIFIEKIKLTVTDNGEKYEKSYYRAKNIVGDIYRTPDVILK